jgi:hypothetical protein
MKTGTDSIDAICASPRPTMRGQDDQVTGDVGGEQPVDDAKADNVGAPGRDAQHDQQRSVARPSSSAFSI